MSFDALFERDMLYPTENLNEPGSVHIQVLNPDNNARIPVIIENKSLHSPIDNLDSIIRNMQSEIFDRILVDVKKTVNIYIITTSGLENISEGKPFIKVAYGPKGFMFTGVDKIG